MKRQIKKNKLGNLFLGDAYIKWFHSQDYYNSDAIGVIEASASVQSAQSGRIEFHGKKKLNALINYQEKYFKNKLFRKWVASENEEVNDYWENWMKTLFNEFRIANSENIIYKLHNSKRHINNFYKEACNSMNQFVTYFGLISE